MLDSSQLPLKLILFLFMGLFFISSGLALELGISPPILSFKGETENKICKEFKIFSDREGLNLQLNNKWANKNTLSKDIKDYSYNGEKFEIETEYYDRIIVDKEYLGEICIKAKNKGIYYGLLEVNSQNGNVGLGSWMIANITENKRFRPITGKVIEQEFNKGLNWGIFYLVALMLSLLIMLFILIRRKSISY